MSFEEIREKIQDQMSKGLESLRVQFSKIRTGRASPSLLDNIKVDSYGQLVPLKQIAQISASEARVLQIRPFDKTSISSIEKAIFAANLGVTPSNDGNLVRIPFPALTEERRKEQLKELKKMAEDARVSLRNIRREAVESLKKLEKSKLITEDDLKNFQQKVQEITDSFIKKVDEASLVKEKEIMTV